MRSPLVCSALTLLICIGCSSSSSSAPPKTNTLDNSWNVVTGKTALKSVQKMEDSHSADNRRKGIYELAKTDFGQRDPYIRRYRQIAQNDPDFTVRAAAIRASNWSRDKQAVPVFVSALNDANELVRWEAAKALSNVPDASAVEALTKTVGNAAETKNVRIAAADALRHYKNFSAARALVATLGGKDFGLAWQSRQSLRVMTGNDLRYDERAWLEYLTSNAKPLG
jgi:hypothetical protein